MSLKFDPLQSFAFFLTRQAVSRPRHGLQALVIDVVSAADALSKGIVIDPFQSLFNHVQHLPLLAASLE